jgi:SpoIID/LytB domain protein
MNQNKQFAAPEIHVGILKARKVRIILSGPHHILNNTESLQDSWVAEVKGGFFELRGPEKAFKIGNELILSPRDLNAQQFTIKDVLIGIGFHWEQEEDQVFKGALKLKWVDGEIQVINLVPVEDYLVSVISSEMRGDSSPDLLRAHTIISRSWLLAQIEKQEKLEEAKEDYTLIHETKDEYIRWYDREDHRDFHVCADDHCQRYQGITRAYNSEVESAVKDTSGEVLSYEGQICDARFSKCCGGVTESFENCWEPVKHPYLQRLEDKPVHEGFDPPDLTVESEARAFILASPEAYCNTTDGSLLSQVLNDYDQGSSDFYRWELSYSQEEISKLIREKSGMDFGDILDLEPVERGHSGRLIRLKITGSRKILVVGKELEIRRWLSPSHLYSSAFLVEKENISGGIPGEFKLRGAGWGHGVGLCQIGAAVMASRGKTHREILMHYFRGAVIYKMYD